MHPLEWHFVIRSQEEVPQRFRAAYDRVLESWPFEKHPLRMQFGIYQEGRTLSQNALLNVLYREISHQWEGHSEEDTRRFCKLTFGVPIMRRHDDFAAVWDVIADRLDYEQQLAVMGWYEVTRRMNKAEATEYIDEFLNSFQAQNIAVAPQVRSQYEDWAA